MIGMAGNFRLKAETKRGSPLSFHVWQRGQML